MTIKLALLNNIGFVYQPEPLTTSAVTFVSTFQTSQNQQFNSFQIQNGYGTVTQVSVSPGFGAAVLARVSMKVNSITERTFNDILNEVKKSDEYRTNQEFRQEINSASYSSAGSTCCGIFGSLIGGNQHSYSNNRTDLTNQINGYDSGNSSSNVTVANKVANIMVGNQSFVLVEADIWVTGQLLVPSPTVLAVETSNFMFTKQDGTSSSVSILNQTPVQPVNSSNGTASQNTVSPGSQLSIVPMVS